jgi:hypothetical protein
MSTGRTDMDTRVDAAEIIELIRRLREWVHVYENPELAEDLKLAAASMEAMLKDLDTFHRALEGHMRTIYPGFEPESIS